MRGKPDASADLILAADAMIYLSDLAPLLGEAKRLLVAGGLLAFTVETHRGEGVVLGEGLRYAHSAGYVRTSIEACGLPCAVAV
jgi:predicted TPR repeat methyltransferase